MKAESTNLSDKGTIGLVYDVPRKLKNTPPIIFPEDACSEWETQDTIDTIENTWRSLGYDVILFPLDHYFLSYWSERSSECTLIHSLVEGFASLGREGWIPSLCELSGLPFIGSPPFAHNVCMSKFATKLICSQLKIPTPPAYLVKGEDDLHFIPDIFFESPHFIKPDGEGSGMGVDPSFSISNSKNNTISTINNLLKNYPDGILIEKYLEGPEFTSAVIGTPPTFLPVAQIEVDDTGVYGFAFKGKERMEEKVSFPALPKETLDTIKDGTNKLFEFLNMHDFVRMDWKCDQAGNAYFLEANTPAGLSYHYSVLPIMAAQVGYSYSDLLNCLAQSALTRRDDKNLWYGKTRIRK